MELPLAEGPIAQDPTSSLAQYPTVNGYSATGDVVRLPHRAAFESEEHYWCTTLH